MREVHPSVVLCVYIQYILHFINYSLPCHDDGHYHQSAVMDEKDSRLKENQLENERSSEDGQREQMTQFLGNESKNEW